MISLEEFSAGPQDLSILQIRGADVRPRKEEVGFFSLAMFTASEVMYLEDRSQLPLMESNMYVAAPRTTDIRHLRLDLSPANMNSKTFVPYLQESSLSEKGKGLLRWLSQHAEDVAIQELRKINQVTFVLLDFNMERVLTTPYNHKLARGIGWEISVERVGNHIYCSMEGAIGKFVKPEIYYSNGRYRRFLQDNDSVTVVAQPINPNNEFVSVQKLVIGGIPFLHAQTVNVAYNNPGEETARYASCFSVTANHHGTNLYTRPDARRMWGRAVLSMSEKALVAWYSDRYPYTAIDSIECVDIRSIPERVQTATRSLPYRFWTPDACFGFWLTLFEAIKRCATKQAIMAKYKVIYSGARSGMAAEDASVASDTVSIHEIPVQQ